MKKIAFLFFFFANCSILFGQQNYPKKFTNIRFSQGEYGRDIRLLEFWKPGDTTPLKTLNLREINPFGKFKEKIIGSYKEYETPIYQLAAPKKQIDSFVLVSPSRHLETDELDVHKLYSYFIVSSLQIQNKSVAIAYELAALNRYDANIATTSIIYVYDSLGNIMTQTPIMDVHCERPAVSPDGRFIFFMVGGPEGTEIGGNYIKPEYWVYDTKAKKIVYKFVEKIIEVNYEAVPNGFFVVNDMYTYSNEGYDKYSVFDFYNMKVHTLSLSFQDSKAIVDFDSEGFIFYHKTTKKSYKKLYSEDFKTTEIK